MMQLLMARARANHSARPFDETARSIYDKCVSWWEMDETSGTDMIDSKGSNDGTITSVSLNQSGLAINIANSYGFTTNSAAAVPHDASLAITDNVSCIAWAVLVGGQADYPKLLWKGAGIDLSGGGTYLIQAESGGGIGFRVTVSGTNYSARAPNLWTSGTPFFFSGTRGGTSIKAYLNGSIVDSTSCASGSAATSSVNLTIGYRVDSGDHISGRVGQTAVFDSVLTADEIAYLYNSGDGLSYSQLKTLAGR